MKSILDPSFHYTPSNQTDIRKTFARVRRELRRAAEALGARGVEKPIVTVTNVTSIYPGRRGGS
jgi:hypothetical protein